MIKDKKVPVFILLFMTFLIMFENSISKLISLNQASLLMKQNPILKFEIVKNQGAAWGIFQNSTLFLIIIGVLISSGVFIYAARKLSFKDKLEVLSLTLFVSGAIGNTIERIKQGYVLDYIKLGFIDFPNFNIFDISIVFGILLIVYCLFKKEIKGDKHNL